MKDNVFIKVFERGKLRTTRSGHNVWVENGNQFLAQLISFLQFSPDVPERTDRVRYMGFGIGSVAQGDISSVSAPPFSTSYPAGDDPNATTGNTYNKDYPISPMISTLERPVRVTGGTNPYSTAPPSDIWLVEHPDFFTTHQSLTSVNFHGIVSGPDGDVAYGPFTSVPLSEVGLFTDAVPVSPFVPFSPLVAYFSFDTIPMTPDTVVELIWTVSF